MLWHSIWARPTAGQLACCHLKKGKQRGSQLGSLIQAKAEEVQLLLVKNGGRLGSGRIKREGDGVLRLLLVMPPLAALLRPLWVASDLVPTLTYHSPSSTREGHGES